MFKTVVTKGVKLISHNMKSWESRSWAKKDRQYLVNNSTISCTADAMIDLRMLMEQY